MEIATGETEDPAPSDEPVLLATVVSSSLQQRRQRVT